MEGKVMRMGNIWRWLAACLASYAVALSCPLAAAMLPAGVAGELTRMGISERSVAIWVHKLGNVEPELSHQPDRAMNPASVMKLVTTYAAFDVLGPTHTWKTRVFTDRKPVNGVLDGNLYIAGEGDPALTVERLWRLLRGIRGQGVRDIRGDVVLDRSAWQLPPFDPSAFDGRGFRPYNAGPDALLINFSALRLSFLSTGEGGSPRVISDPPLEGIKVVSALRKGEGRCGEWDERLDVELLRPGNQTVIRVGGEWRDSCGRRDWFVAPMAPGAYSRAVVAGMWKELGGRLRGSVRDGQTPDSARSLSVEVSPTLAEVARDMNKWSNNVQARHLLATLGAEAGGQPDAVSAGARVLVERLGELGIDQSAVMVENGSGLSRVGAISARALGRMLDAAFSKPWMPEFMASLSLAGIDGTARRRLSRSPARGYAHVKTGTINGTRAVAGYVLDRHGARHAVVMMVNDPQAWASRQAQDALLEWVWHGAGAAEPVRLAR